MKILLDCQSLLGWSQVGQIWRPSTTLLLMKMDVYLGDCYLFMGWEVNIENTEGWVNGHVMCLADSGPLGPVGYG